MKKLAQGHREQPGLKVEQFGSTALFNQQTSACIKQVLRTKCLGTRTS